MYNVEDEEAMASLRNSNQTSSKLSHNSSYKTTQRRSRHSSKICEACTQTENHKLPKFIINIPRRHTYVSDIHGSVHHDTIFTK